MKEVIQKAKSIVNGIRKSLSDTEKLKNAVGFVIPMCNLTRWNSDLTMLIALVKALKQAPWLQDQLNSFKRHGKLCPRALKILRELIFILRPVKEATDEFQKDAETVGSVIPAIEELKKKLKVFSDPINVNNPISVCESFAKALLDSLEKRFDYIYKDPFYVLGKELLLC